MSRLLALISMAILLHFSVATPSIPAEKVGTDCAMTGVAYAPCPGTTKLFRSVIVALPGWNGKCESTFGTDEGNVLNVMRQPKFFDVDCYDYDSHNVSLADSEKLLREHLVALQQMGYQEVSFITHSTGGILALKLILDELLTPDGKSLRSGTDRSFLFRTDEGSLRLRAVYSWGIPINGIRDQECAGGWFIGLFGLSTAVLPHLCKDSKFLVELKGSYVGLNALLDSLPAHERLGELGYNLFLFQGQGADWVVNPIEAHEPWFPTNAKVQPVNTDAPHTKVISTNGTIEMPTFAGLTMTDLAQLTFSLLPRSEEYFASDLVATGTLHAAQTSILNGVVDFAGIGNLFLAGYRQVSKFTLMLFKDRFVRGPNFDAYAVDRLDQLLRTKFGQISKEDAVRYGDLLLTDIERGYTSLNEADKAAFGGQSKSAIRKLADTVAFVFQGVQDAIAKNPPLENELIVSGSLTVFEQRVGEVLKRLRQDRDETVRAAALNTLETYVSTVSLQTLEAFDFEGTFAAYGRANYNLVTAEEKQAFGEALVAYSARSNRAQAETLQLLTEERPFLGSDAPLWASLLTGEQLTQLIQTEQRTEQQPQWPVFLAQVVGSAGRYGQSYTAGSLAIEQFRPLLEQADANERGAYETVFVEGIRQTEFPAIRLRGERLLTEFNFGGDFQ